MTYDADDAGCYPVELPVSIAAAQGAGFASAVAELRPDEGPASSPRRGFDSPVPSKKASSISDREGDPALVADRPGDVGSVPRGLSSSPD